MDQDKNYPVSDWQYEVANGDTILGYQGWVEHMYDLNRML